MTTTPTRSVVPLAIWPVAQTSAPSQRAGRYHPDSSAHPGKMLPELARRIIGEYSQPGSTVVDPMAGIGTTVVEAALAGHRSVGVELEARWATVADANLDHLLPADRRHLAEVTVGDARRLPEILGPLSGRVDLIVTSSPYAGDAAVIDWANLGYARGPAYEAAVAEIYAACYRVLRPGGRMVVVTTNTRRHGRTLDLAGLTVAVAQAAGFAYLQHVIALHAAIRDGELVARPSYWQPGSVRQP